MLKNKLQQAILKTWSERGSDHFHLEVGLSGGVMQNAIMARLLPQALDHMGLKALTHHELPPGDGGLSLGQAVWGRRMLAAGAGQ